LIRVWIGTGSAVTRAGLEALLESGGGVELVESLSDADVELLDELPEKPGALPMVILSDQPLTSRWLRFGVLAILPREAAADQITAALYAASAGLIAIPAESAPSIFPTFTESVIENLTPREMEALEMLAEGLSNKHIAARLNISEHTAKFHVNSVLSKLGAATRTEAVMRGLRSGLIKV
jgi:two-component system nitrate/nitrite response regulator NarL